MSFARTGEAAAKNYLLTNEAVAKNSWDPNKLIKESIKGRSAEKQMAAAADAAKFVSKQNSRIVEAKTQLAVDEFNVKQDLKKSSRKAGIIAAAGSYMAKNFQKTPDPKKPYQSDTSIYDEVLQQQQQSLTRLENRSTELDTKIDTIRNQDTNAIPTVGSDPTSATSGTLTPISSAQGVSAGKGSGGSSAKYDLTAMTNYAIQGGFSPQNARTMAAISMGESGGRAGIDTVQSGLDPNMSNEFSVGLSQINVQAHGDKLARRGWTAEDLRDPVKNMTIAKEVFDEAGGFRPWSVYQQGSHQQYLQ